MRVGFGYDIHRLITGRDLILGGVILNSKVGEDGYSDGDVLTHAIIDALLGATGQGDIGEHFPQGDPRYKNISSRILLEQTINLLKVEKYQIINIDCTVILQKPKLSPYKEQIKSMLAHDLKINPDLVSIKVKTKEELGVTGSGKAIEAYAVVLLEKETS